jgi:hypothetical protein
METMSLPSASSGLHGGEVAHRRLRGRRSLVAGAEALVEARVFGSGDFDLGTLLALERDVEADPWMPFSAISSSGGRPWCR